MLRLAPALLLLLVPARADPTAKITVYYEVCTVHCTVQCCTDLCQALCGDSMRFVTGQLYPVWREFGSQLNIELVPFGKANVSNVRSCFSDVG